VKAKYAIQASAISTAITMASQGPRRRSALAGRS
jgi:hypothetical protein